MNPIRVLFFGTPDFAAQALQALIDDDQYKVVGVVTQPDRQAGRGRKVQSPPVKLTAIEAQLPVLQPGRIKKDVDGFLKEVEAFGECDISVVSAFGQILPQEVLDYPKSSISVNTHASLLPRWRGAAPIQRAIMAGDPTTGIGLMHMEAGLDTGGIYSQSEIPITDQDTAGTLHDNLANTCATLLVQDLKKIALGEITFTPQSDEGITYAEKITTEEALIDWSKGNREVSCHIRGLSPFPGAHTTFRNKRLKIQLATAKTPFSGSTVEPGQIHMVDKNTLAIQCGKDIVSIDKLQLEGKKACSVEEFIRGYQPKIGEQLGSSR